MLSYSPSLPLTGKRRRDGEVGKKLSLQLQVMNFFCYQKAGASA